MLKSTFVNMKMSIFVQPRLPFAPPPLCTRGRVAQEEALFAFSKEH